VAVGDAGGAHVDAATVVDERDGPRAAAGAISAAATRTDLGWRRMVG
jgi:hypothetical protein